VFVFMDYACKYILDGCETSFYIACMSKIWSTYRNNGTYADRLPTG
jgi:hypothetical protein